MTRVGEAMVIGLIEALSASWLAAQPSAPTFGVGSTSAYVLTAWDMQTSSSTSQWEQDPANGHRYLTGGAGLLTAGVRLPSGAQIVGAWLEACDSSDIGGVSFGLFRFDSVFGGPVTELATLETGTGYNLGCSSWATELAVPETVDNQYYRYLVQGGNETIDGLTTVGAIRIYYRLQVSPAGFPSFNDVPASDPGFQFIEALVSSGITAGCGNGNYCPDAPLTRRQMAVFLAKALGLHWPDIPGVN